MKTQFNPPEEILVVLHDAEKAGVKIPKIVDDWWLQETMFQKNPNQICKVCRDIHEFAYRGCSDKCSKKEII